MGRKPATLVEALLEELCVDCGYCLPPKDQEALVADPPRSVEAFVHAVLVAEGMDLADREARLDISAVVEQWLFDEGEGKGSKSGLPLLPPG